MIHRTVTRRRSNLCRAGLVLGLFVAGVWHAAGERACAEPPSRRAVDQASYERDLRGERAESVRFARRAPEVGDQIEQTVAVEMRLDTTVRQGNEVLEQAKTLIRREQLRLVTTTDVESGRAVAALVRYAEAKKQVDGGLAGDTLGGTAATPEPVEGKAYRCRRAGDALEITDAAGSIPPVDEYRIVAQNMDWLGRENPLADHLAGRTIRVGQSLELPEEVGQRLLGLGDALGEVKRFQLTLESVQAVAGTPCGVFRASIDAASRDSSQMRLQLEGPLWIETTTCRAVQAEVSGPIGMSETRGSLTATYQMTGTGRMTLQIASRYSDVGR